MCISPVNAVWLALVSGLIYLRSIEPGLSGNPFKFLEIFKPDWNLPYCLETFHPLQEYSRLSGNSPDSPKILQVVWKSSRLSRNFLNSSEIFQTAQNILKTVHKSFTLSRNCSDRLEIIQTVRKSSRLSGYLQDCLEIFQTVQNIFQTVRKSFRLSENLPDRPELFKIFDWRLLFRIYLRHVFEKLSG